MGRSTIDNSAVIIYKLSASSMQIEGRKTMAPDQKVRACRYNWGNLPPSLISLLRAFGRKKSAGRFRFPAEIKNCIMRNHRSYNDESGMADDAQRWLGTIGVFVQHKPGGGEQSYWYFDKERAEAVIDYLEAKGSQKKKKIDRPRAPTDQQRTDRASALAEAFLQVDDAGGPEVVPMSPQMRRVRDEHLARTGSHPAVVVGASTGTAPPGDEVDTAETVVDVPAPVVGDGDEASASRPASLESSATVRRVLFCTQAEWWVWSHLRDLCRVVEGCGKRVGVGETDEVMTLEFDLFGDDPERPDLADCMAAIDRFEDHKLIKRLGDGGGDHGTYQFLVDPRAFFVEIIDRRHEIGIEGAYLHIVIEMMQEKGPDHNQSRWEEKLGMWLSAGGYSINAGTLRGKVNGSQEKSFDPKRPSKAWCVWYKRRLSEGFSRWLLAWPGFTIVELEDAARASQRPRASSAPRRQRGVDAPAPTVSAAPSSNEEAPDMGPGIAAASVDAPGNEPDDSTEAVGTPPGGSDIDAPEEVADVPDPDWPETVEVGVVPDELDDGVSEVPEEAAGVAAAEVAEEEPSEQGQGVSDDVVADGPAETDRIEDSANEEPTPPDGFEAKLREERERIREELSGQDVDRIVAEQSRLEVDIESLDRRIADMRARKEDLDEKIARVKPLSRRADQIDAILEDKSLVEFLSGVAAS